MVLKGEEQGEAGTLEEVMARKGDGERCRRPGLKALLGSLSWAWLALAGVSSRLEASRRHAEDGRVPGLKGGLGCPR